MKLLAKENFALLTDRVRQLPFNNLFARAVVEQMVTGKIYVDDSPDIKTAYIIHPYGMTLLLGDTNQADFNEQFKIYALNENNKRSTMEWMQTYPDQWADKLNEIFGERLIEPAKPDLTNEKGIIELHTRVNFKFDRAIYRVKKIEQYDPDIAIVATDRQQYGEMRGTVIPKNFWDSEDDFFENGMAYSLLYKGQLASMAFSSYKFDNQFELGIETHPEFRGKGFAELACAALIEYCLDNNYEPIWACRKDNRGSYQLALKLGFQPVIELPYYRLSH